MKAFGLFLLAIVGSLVLYVVVALAGSALHIFTLPFVKLGSKVQTNEDIIKKTYNADNALAQYHYFKETYEAIQADQNKIAQAKAAVTSFEASAGPRSTWTFEDKTEDGRLNAVVQGLQSHYEDLVAEYNAKAKEADRSVFKDNLPLFIDLN